MKTCKNCGCEIKEFDTCHTVNFGLPEEYIQCDGCHDDQWDRNDITMCEACGQWYEVDKLHRRDNHSEFTPCPNCGCDIVEALTEQEFDAAYGNGKTLSFEEEFRQFIIGKLEAQDKKEITVSNIRFWTNGDVVADISYLWSLNGHEKHAEHKDSIFVKKDSIWLSPVLF